MTFPAWAPDRAPTTRRGACKVFVALALLAVPLTAIAAAPTPASAAGGSPVMGASRLNAAQIAAWFRASSRSPYRASVSVEQLAGAYVSEGAIANVRGDVAFAQSVLETGWFSFPAGGYVQPGDNNFAGIGAYGDGSHLLRAPDAVTGVRAQVQLLRRYADPYSNQYNIGAPPVAQLWNPASRYDIPNGTHGWAPTWNQMSGTWASSTTYAESIFRLYDSMLTFNGLPAELLATGTAPVWWGWEPLGGGLAGGPDVASWAPNRLDTFVRGTDGQLYHRWWDGTAWWGWEPLGGALASDPTAVSWGPNRLDVFARGTDGQTWHKWWDGTAWWGWEPLGGALAGSPDSASWGSNRLDVFGRGAGDALVHTWWDGVRWNAWETFDGTTTSDPSGVGSAPGYLDVYGRATSGALEHRRWDGVTWSPWSPLDGTLASGPDSSAWPGGRLDVFVQGTDGQLWQTSWQGIDRTVWSGLGGGIAGDPGAVSWAPGRIDVFVRGTDGHLWHRWYS